MGNQHSSRSSERGVGRSFQVAQLERRLLMCVEHAQHGHLPEDLGTFGVYLDVPYATDTTATGTSALAGAAMAPLTSVPVLSSRPGATAKLYLDFNGEAPAEWGEFTPGATPAYDQDGLATSFSSGELSSIREIWSRVAEKYSPFNIDVTTVDPGNLSNYQTSSVVFGGTGDWLGAPAGGIAYVGGFYNSAPNTSYVFTKNLGNGDARHAAEAAAHESGHLFGLQHQGQWSGTTLVSEYSAGTSAAAPIMGNSFAAPRGLWWRGTPSTSPASVQDDMGVIGGSTNRFGYRADDFGSTIAAAGQLTMSDDTFTASGVIERSTDWDYFRFNTGAGAVSFDAATLAAGATLDLQLGLFDSAGTRVALASTSSLGEKLAANVAAGTYYLGVGSRGNYGDVGQYTLSGTVVAIDTTDEDTTTNTRTAITVSRRRAVDIFSNTRVATYESVRPTTRMQRFDFGLRDQVVL